MGVFKQNIFHKNILFFSLKMSAQGGGGNIILVSLAKHTDLILNRSPDSAWFSEAGSPAVLLSSSHYILG